MLNRHENGWTYVETPVDSRGDLIFLIGFEKMGQKLIFCEKMRFLNLFKLF